MNANDAVVYFVHYIGPPLILALGLIGNTLGICNLSQKELKNIGPRKMYTFLLYTDLFYLLSIVVIYLQFAFDINLGNVSTITCKLWNYLYYTFATISSWLIVYISVDRCGCILRPAWRFMLRKRKTQLYWFIGVNVVCIIYYIPVGIYFKDIPTIIDDNNNKTHIKFECGFEDTFSLQLISYTDLVIRVLIPFFLMIFSSLTLMYALFNARLRIVANFLAEENQTFSKEFRLSLTSICLNLIYIVTQLPVSITVFGSQFYSNFYYEWSAYLFYMSYAMNFYIILATNSLFRSGFVKLFSK